MASQVLVVINATQVPIAAGSTLVDPGLTSPAITLPAGSTSIELTSTAASTWTRNTLQTPPVMVSLQAGMVSFPWAYANPYSTFTFADISVVSPLSGAATTITVTTARNPGWMGATPQGYNTVMPSPAPDATGVFVGQPSLPLVPSVPFSLRSKNTPSTRACVAAWACGGAASPAWSTSPNGPYVQLVSRGDAYVLQHLTPGATPGSTPNASFYAWQPRTGLGAGAALVCTPDAALAAPVTVLQDIAGQADRTGGVVLVFQDSSSVPGAWILDASNMCVVGAPSALALTQTSTTNVTAFPGFAFVLPFGSAPEAVLLQLPSASQIPSRISNKTFDCCATVNAGCPAGSSLCTVAQTATGAFLCPTATCKFNPNSLAWLPWLLFAIFLAGALAVSIFLGVKYHKK